LAKTGPNLIALIERPGRTFGELQPFTDRCNASIMVNFAPEKGQPGIGVPNGSCVCLGFHPWFVRNLDTKVQFGAKKL